MTDDRKHFLQRMLWTLIPGLVAGMITGGIAWGTIQTQVEFMQRDIERIERKANRNRRVIFEYVAEQE